MRLKSIRAHLLVWQVISLLFLSLISYPLINWIANKLSDQIYDDHLLNSSDSILARIENDRTAIDVDLPASSRNLLEHQDIDNFYYQILNSDNQLIDSDHASQLLPLPAKRAIINKPVFYEGVLDGEKIRVLETQVPHPTTSGKFIYVEVAETLNTRLAFARQILLALMSTQIIFTASSVLVIFISVGKGLAPLKTIEQSLANRNIADLKPLSLSDTPAEVSSLVRTIDQLLEQVREHIQVQSRFSANVAHQLRTPLSGVKTYVDIALRQSTESKVHEILEQINHGVCRLISVIEKMLILARSEATLVASQVNSIVDLNLIVLEALAELNSYAKEKQIESVFSSHASAAKVLGDAFSLHELIRNILENAITYSPAKSKIQISTLVDGNVSLIIEDRGPGIDSNERELVFEPFYRSSSNVTPGSGLGLSIVKDIAKAHQAKVSIEETSESGGARILVKFPLPENNNLARL